MPIEPDRFLQFWLGLYMTTLFVGLVAALALLWPVPPGNHALASSVDLPLEIRYLFLVAVGGALGSYIHLATSFADHSGARRLTANWTWWYLLRPFIGAALALLVYFAARGGLIQGSDASTTAALSPYGLAAMAGMSGLFSRHATAKLREVFETLFRTRENPSPDGDYPSVVIAPPPDQEKS